MITAVRQINMYFYRIFNAVCMYFYLIYYTERLRRDKRYMMKEALRVNAERTLAKRMEIIRTMAWRQ